MTDKQTHEITGTLLFDTERDHLLLEGNELSPDENIEIRVQGFWVPGKVAVDAAGWYLATLDQVSIRLHTGLPARSGGGRSSSQITLQTNSYEGSPRVLIVDDDPSLLIALPRTISLRLPHIQVETANSSALALQLVQERRYEAIVSDIKMPGMDGLTLLTKIRDIQPETPTILITGHGEHDVAVRALRAGAYEYMQKPIERDDFAASLQRAVQTCQLRRQVREQQLALESYAHSLEQLVQQRTDELAEAHTTKDKVISLVSQELREPITRLKTITQVLYQKLETVDLSEIVTNSFVDIEISIARTENLLQELLYTSDIEMQRFILHRQHCDLVQICQDVLETESIDTETHLEYEGVAGPVSVEVDREQISRVLRLLIESTRSTSKPAEAMVITLQQAGRAAILTMRDHGAHLLGADFYISRKIVECHQGHIEIQSFPQNRRALFLTLPLLRAQNQHEVDYPIPHTHAAWILSSVPENVISETA